MSIEMPSVDDNRAKMAIQREVISQTLGFDINDFENETPENAARIIKWAADNAEYFQQVLEHNPDVWEKIANGTAGYPEVRWLLDQLRDYDTGAEDHDTQEPEFDA